MKGLKSKKLRIASIIAAVILIAIVVTLILMGNKGHESSSQSNTQQNNSALGNASDYVSAGATTVDDVNAIDNAMATNDSEFSSTSLNDLG